jgi:hypothetical protein
LRPHTDDLRTTPLVETVDEAEAAESPDVSDTPGEPQTARKLLIYNIQDSFDVPVHLPRFSPEELLGLTYLHKIEDDQRVRAKIVKKVLDRNAANHERIKMLISYDDGKVEEIVSYNELCDIVAEQHDDEMFGIKDLFTFREIIDHEGPLLPGDKRYKGSKYNVKVIWEDYSKT